MKSCKPNEIIIMTNEYTKGKVVVPFITYFINTVILLLSIIRRCIENMLDEI